MPRRKKTKIIYPDLSYEIYGVCYDAHNELGRFKSEKSYTDKLEALFEKKGIKFSREIPLSKSFKEENSRRNIPDFIIENKIILDIKAKRIITKEDYFQMKRYLDASKMKLGLIANFRQKYLTPKRVAN